MSNQVLISQKSSCHPFDFADAAHHILKTKESKKIYKYMELARELRLLWNMGDGDINCDWRAWNSLEKAGKRVRRVGSRKTN